MNFMYQTYNDIDIKQNATTVCIHLKITKSVFKHLMIPFVITCLVFLFIGISSLFTSLVNDTDSIFILLIWNSFACVLTYKTLTECLWLLKKKEKVSLDLTHMTLEKTYPLRFFQKNYTKKQMIDISEIINIQYDFWVQPTANLNLPKLEDGQILIETKQQKIYFGINLTDAEVKKILIVIKNHLQKNTLYTLIK